MKKTIALVLAMTMLLNCVAWADTEEAEEEDSSVALVIVGVTFVVCLAIWGLCALVGIASADEPDNGLRLASMPGSQAQPETDTGAALRALQHIDVGVTADSKAYLGLRFQF